MEACIDFQDIMEDPNIQTLDQNPSGETIQTLTSDTNGMFYLISHNFKLTIKESHEINFP